MMNTMKKILTEWSNTTDAREKLQQMYIVVAGVLVMAAGVVGLINYDLGQKILFVAILAIAMFFINAVAWALLQSFVLFKIGTEQVTEKLAPKTTQATKKKSTKKK